MRCHICESRETVDSLIQLQLGAAPVQIPLCRYHLAVCEGALAEVRRIQTGPVAVNVAGVVAGGAGSRFG